MSNHVKYTIYIEEANVSLVGLTPKIENFYHVDQDNGTNNDLALDPNFTLPTISEIGNGFYSFDFDWSSYASPIFLLRINSGHESQRIITLKIEEHDILNRRANQIKTLAEQLKTIADRLDKHVQRILDIEQGEWYIENNQLFITSADRSIQYAVFDLKDQNDIPNSTSPTQRIVNTILAIEE